MEGNIQNEELIPTDKLGRIQPIDGWRALAALGVLWTHTWATAHFHSIIVGNIDLYKSINLVGNGVHLFFVISGFCMYLILRKQKNYTLKVFIDFIKKRWIRIAPAFYFACIVIGLFNLIVKGENLLPRILYNFIFLQNHLSNSVVSGPFWSLAVEWHFYIILPLLFMVINKVGFFKGVFIFCVLSIALNILHYNNFLLPGEGWRYFLPGNLIHFMWGILLSYIITNNKQLPAWLSKGFSFILALALANFGKTLFSKYALDLAGNYKWIILSTGPAIMTLGFCWLIYISLKNDFVSSIIGNKYFAGLGKISYSFYLWHSFVLELVYGVIKNYLHFGGFDPLILFILTLIILLPVSYFSYTVFESFYFNRKTKAKVFKPMLTSAT